MASRKAGTKFPLTKAALGVLAIGVFLGGWVMAASAGSEPSLCRRTDAGQPTDLAAEQSSAITLSQLNVRVARVARRQSAGARQVRASTHAFAVWHLGGPLPDDSHAPTSEKRG